MSYKRARRLRRTIRKESAKIKVEGLSEFINFCNNHKFFGRLKIAYKILFKRIEK